MENLLIRLNSPFLIEKMNLSILAINLACFIFLKNKINCKKFSNLLTASILFANSTIALINYIFGENSKLEILNNLFVFNKETMIPEFIINSFLFCFILITKRLIKNAKKIPLLNSILLLIAITAGLLAISQNPIMTYVFLSFSAYLIYIFAKNMQNKIEINRIYSINFLCINFCADIIFLALTLMANFLIKNPFQLSIIEVCLSGAILLKIGIFPVFNYINNSILKQNMPYSLLLYNFLPFEGIIACNKMFLLISPLNEAFQVTMLFFVIFTMFISSISAFRETNLVRFLAYIANFAFQICIINIVFFSTNLVSIKLASAVLMIMSGIYSLICILKINTKQTTLNNSILNGIFVYNKPFAFLFTILLLMSLGVIPNYLTKLYSEILCEIYIFDKTGLYFVLGILGCSVLILFNTLKVIEKCYNFDKIYIKKKMAKRTIFNYIIPSAIIILLIVLNIL